MSHPAKGTMRPPSERCSASSGLWRTSPPSGGGLALVMAAEPNWRPCTARGGCSGVPDEHLSFLWSAGWPTGRRLVVSAEDGRGRPGAQADFGRLDGDSAGGATGATGGAGGSASQKGGASPFSPTSCDGGSSPYFISRLR